MNEEDRRDAERLALIWIRPNEVLCRSHLAFVSGYAAACEAKRALPTKKALHELKLKVDGAVMKYTHDVLGPLNISLAHQLGLCEVIQTCFNEASRDHC